MKAVRLRTEQMKNPMGIDVSRPYLSWVCEDGIKQTAYEIEAKVDGQVVWNSGKVASARMNAGLDQQLKSRQHVTWQVRVWDENDTASQWSEEAFFEMGLLHTEEFVAQWINPELEIQKDVKAPAAYLRKSFTLEKMGTGRLYITAHGLYEAEINGTRVGSFVLAPGTGSYDKKIAYQTYDVTSLLQEGTNEVQVVLGDGWYRSCSGVDGERNLFGEDIALFFQLEVDGKAVCVSDDSWEATQEGPIRENDMQQGEVYDASYEELTGWHPVKVEDDSKEVLACSNSVAIIEAERFPGKLITTPNGETVVDYGQNLAGYIEFTVDAHAGEKIVIHHGETLDENGNFTNENFQDRKRHKENGIEQRVEYICKEGKNHYKSKFTIWGFQYGKIETNVDLSTAEFTSIAVYSQMDQIGSFTCSDANVNQLFKNSIWSMKGNFCDIPTDCPTRERAGWTGDAGVFVDTGIFLEDCYSVFRKWLGECRLIQQKDGKVYNIAPPNGKPSMFTNLLSGSVGWGDASIIVPYALYKRYDNVAILEENYEMMKQWYAFLESRAKKKDLKSIFKKKNPYSDYTIETGIDYGEWCEPDVDGQMAMRNPSAIVATAYFARSGEMLSEIAHILGQEEDAARYQNIAENAKKAFHYIATEDGRIHSDRQCQYVRAISFGLLSEEEMKVAAADLNQMVVDNGYHLNTGFLSTPFLCQVLADYGYLETAYKLLLQDTMPSWLYEVKKGANTIWETWDGINEENVPHASLNHYSYGAISGWLMSGICGIHLENGALSFAPLPYPALDHAKATYESPVGRIESSWKYEGDKVVYEFLVPANVTATVKLLDGREETLTAGRHTL